MSLTHFLSYVSIPHDLLQKELAKLNTAVKQKTRLVRRVFYLTNHFNQSF